MTEIDDSNSGLVDDPPKMTNQEILRALLAKYSEQCPSCKYDLHKLTGRHCPECGQELVPRIELESPNLASFVTGLVGLSGGLGFSGLLLTYYLWKLYENGFVTWNMSEVQFSVVLAIEFLISCVIFFIWIIFSGFIRRMRARKRWIMAVVCFSFPIIFLIIFCSQFGS